MNDGPIKEPHETPYQAHATLAHKMTRHSPNGVDIIEECSDCGMRWLHNPCIGYPVTMDPRRCETLTEWAKRTGNIIETRTNPHTNEPYTFVVLDHFARGRSDLWHLEDYTVSGVSGPVVYLVPRPKKESV